MNFVNIYDLFGLNHWLFFVINRAHTTAIDVLAMAGSMLGNFWNFPFVLAAGVLILWMPRRSPVAAKWLPDGQATLRVLLRLTLGYGIAMVLVTLLKFGLHIPRPSVALPAGSVQVLGPPETSFGFPSGHATFAMLLAVTLWSSCRHGVQGLLIIYTVWVGIARISLGAHFPTDVLAGYACGALSAWAAFRILTLCAHSQRTSSRLQWKR